jgi:hypothetical protein
VKIKKQYGDRELEDTIHHDTNLGIPQFRNGKHGLGDRDLLHGSAGDMQVTPRTHPCIPRLLVSVVHLDLFFLVRPWTIS